MANATSTLLKALRQASTPTAISSAMDEAVDHLISTHSLAETQNLVLGLQHYRSTGGWHERLQQAAAICTEPLSKAEYLGLVLFQESVHLLETIPGPTQRQVLLKVFNANKSVLSGYLAALTAGDGHVLSSSVDSQRAKTIVGIISPVLKNVLVDSYQPEGHKAAVLDVMTRIAWYFDGQEDHNAKAVRTAVVHILVQALELVPHVQLSQRSYVIHVTLLVDLLSSDAVYGKELVEIVTRTAHFVLESTQLLIERNVGAVALLQSLEQLAQAVPEALWCSVFLTSAAYFLVSKCKTPLEQQLMLRVLQHPLAFGRDVAVGHERTAYVEILLLPLSSMLSAHGSVVSKLLHLVMEIMSRNKYCGKKEATNGMPPTETATHAHTALQMIDDVEGCQRWLNSLFLSKDVVSRNTTDQWLVLLLVALLSDGRPALRDAATKCLDRQVNNAPKFWDDDITKALVASLVFLVSQQTLPGRVFGEWMTSCLYSLAMLAATTIDTMRIVLRLIDSMNGVATMRPMALKLMFEVWRNESRVFPRLETMLIEPSTPDDTVERHVVRMATIKALCERDPELGVQFISCIQEFIEDELESVVAMAMDAITALCKGDCLDFYVAFKIIAQKVRKNKVTCAERALFQERLCCFYALGSVDSTANKKHAAKLLNQVWEFADSEHANVRESAYEVLCKFPLDMVGLCMPDDDIAQHASDDEDGMTIDEVEEQVDDLMARLQNERVPAVCAVIERLMARVVEYESAKLTVGIGRGQRMVSAASETQRQQQSWSTVAVSAAATKEMKALLPSRTEVESLFSSSTDWSGFLLAYHPKASLDMTNVKRKDKLVRLATQNVDELVGTVTTVLQSMELPWTTISASVDGDRNFKSFLRIQTLMEGWRGFMETYLASLDELAELKTPVGVDDADVAFRVFSEGVASLFDMLLNDVANKGGSALAAGALAGKLCESRHWKNPHLRLKYEDIVEELLRQLALASEQARVFSTDNSDARNSLIGAAIALQLAFGRRQTDATEDCSNFCAQLERIAKMLMELYQSESDELLTSCALLGLSHIGFLYTNSYELETFEVTQWRHQRVKPIAERILESCLRAKQPSRSSSSHGDAVFPLSETTEASSLTSLSSHFEDCTSSKGVLLRWASLMGLAQLSSGFSSIKRLDWLMNVQRVLTTVWEEGASADIVAVALGPVLLQCVQFNSAPSSSLEKFVATCNQRAAQAATDSLARSFLMMAAASVLCRLESLGGFRSTSQHETKVTLEHITHTLETESRPYALILFSITNFFQWTFGLSGSFIAAMATNIELSLDSSTIIALMKLLHESTKIEQHQDIANAMLGALARYRDRFYVSQTKKSFDVEVRTLPSNTLLAKTLQWLQQTSHEASRAHARSEASVAISLLNCLTAAGAVLPLLDYASFIHRVMLRLCCVDASAACVRFAATQGNCDEFVVKGLLCREWFGNADVVLQAQLMAWLSLAATRVPTHVLETLLTTIFHILHDIWRCDVSSRRSVLLFDSWTTMLENIVDSSTTGRVPATSLEMVTTFLLDKVLVELSFDVDAFDFVKQFTIRVLSKVKYNERSPIETFLRPDMTKYSMWSWWRSGVFVVELAKSGVLTVTKRETSLIFQWILRHSFEEWTEDKLVTVSLQPLIAQIGALIAQCTRPSENMSSLLDVVDAFGRSMSSSLDACMHLDIVKRRVLFTVMASVLSWNAMYSHEKYLLEIAHAKVGNVDTALTVLPFGLIASTGGTNAMSTWSERLHDLYQRTGLIGDEALRYIDMLQECGRQMYRKDCQLQWTVKDED